MNLFLSIDFSHSHVIVECLFPYYLNVCMFSSVALWHGEVTSVCVCVCHPTPDTATDHDADCLLET